MSSIYTRILNYIDCKSDDMMCYKELRWRGMSYRGAEKSLARPTSRSILFDGENISFDASLVIYIYIVLIFLQL